MTTVTPPVSPTTSVGNSIENLEGLFGWTSSAAGATSFTISSPVDPEDGGTRIVFHGSGFDTPSGDALPTTGSFDSMDIYDWDSTLNGGAGGWVLSSSWSDFPDDILVSDLRDWITTDTNDPPDEGNIGAGATSFTDALFGGNDTITGTPGAADDDDELYGFGGDDTLISNGAGNGGERLYGGGGDDTIRVHGAYGGSAIISGDQNNDTLRIDAGGVTSIFAASVSSIENITFAAGANATLQINFDQADGNFATNAVVTGSASADSLMLSADIAGTYDLADVDFSFASWNDDDIFGLFVNGAGDFTLQGDARNNALLGSATTNGNDTLWGDDGDDVLYGGVGGADTLNGQDGDDTIISFNGAFDTLTGGDDGETDGDTLLVWGNQNFTSAFGGVALSGFENLTLAALPGATAVTKVTASFNSNQFGAGFASDLHVTGSDGIADTIQITLVSGATNLDLSEWTFTGWDSDDGDNVRILASAFAYETITGSTGSEIVQNIGNGDAFHGGAGDDTVNLWSDSNKTSWTGATIDGGEGDDTLIVGGWVDLSASSLVSIDAIEFAMSPVFGYPPDNELELNFSDIGAGLSTTAHISGVDGLRDSVTFFASSAGVYDLSAFDFSFTDFGEHSQIWYDADSIGVWVNTSANGVTLVGDDQTNQLYAGTGHGHSFDGAGGDDFIFVTPDTTGDILNGGEGSETYGDTLIGLGDVDYRGASSISNFETISFFSPVLGPTTSAIINQSQLTGFGAAPSVIGDTLSTSTLTIYTSSNSISLASWTIYNWNASSLIKVIGDGGSETITGSAARDRLEGNGGADVLSGGAGADVLIGGAGDDTYVTDGTDTITEASNEGADTVKSSVNFTLSANLENLTLTGTATNAIGNGVNNTLVGNASANTLDGKGGADAMSGAAGNDTYIVDNKDDTVTEGSTTGGTDLVKSSVSFVLGANVENLTLTGTAANAIGNAQNNVLTGNASANTLDGKAGADAMSGAAGNDTYIVDNKDDTVTEGSTTGGTDLVKSSVSFVLAANVENLTLTGTAANAIGNTLANVLTGNASDNTLDGKGGADSMNGGAGNDTYLTDGGDTITESSATGGTDTVKSSAAYTLGANLENLMLTGTGAINGTGNTLANIITGNTAANTLNGASGADTLNGGAGHDTLTGGTGADKFVFTSASAANSDTITDFKHSESDKITFENGVFTGLQSTAGTLAATAFKDLALGAVDTNDRIIYDGVSGNVYYDADGSGAATRVLIATLTGHPALTNADIAVI